MADGSYRFAGPPATSYGFTNLPSGTYKFLLDLCITMPDDAGHITTECFPDLSTQKIVTVTRDTEPALDTTTTEAGTSPYSATVTNRGASHVSIPLKTIAGVNGIAPDLSLEYDSARGTDVSEIFKVSDLLGYGWSLNGLSRIQTCTVGGVSRYCLDGMPLKVVVGTYFAANSEYRTEGQSFVRVYQKAGGGSLNGSYFEADYPDGRIAKFGYTVDSSVGAAGWFYGSNFYPNGTYIWGVNSVTGSFGDSYSVTYERVDAYIELHPKSIAYAGAAVDFKYGPRDDLTSIGSKRLGVLNKIVVSLNSLPVREYRLDSNLVSNQLRLEKVQECGYTESGTLDACLRPLTFGWSTVSGGTNNYNIAVSSVTDGIGKVTEYLYTALTATSNPLNYTEAPFGATIAVANTTAQSLAAVSEMRVSDGLTPTGRRRVTFAYKGFPYRNSVGRGFIGFYEVRQKDEQSGIYSYVQTRLDFPFMGAVSQVWSMNATYGAQTQQISRIENAYAAKSQTGGVQFPYRARTVSWLFEGNTTVGGSEEETTLCYRTLSAGACPGSGTEYEYVTLRTGVLTTGSTISNPAFTPTIWGDVPNRSITGLEQTKTTVTEFANTTTPTWILVAPTKSTISYVVPGETTRTVVNTIAYAAPLNIYGIPVPTREIKQTKRLPGDPSLELTLDRTFAGGVVGSDTISGANGLPSRSVGYQTPYVNGRYVSQITDPLNHIDQYDYDLRFGAEKSHTDPNGNGTTHDYDAFGRLIRTTTVDQTDADITYERCDVVDCSAVVNAVAALKVTTAVTNGGVQVAPTRIRYLDVVGREVLSTVEALNSANGWRGQRTEYDARNRVKYVSKAYFSTQTTPTCTAAGANCTWFTYDLLDRVTREDRPDGGFTTTGFTAVAGTETITVTDTVKQTGSADVTRAKQSQFNVLGQLTQTTDAYGTGSAITTTYDYDAQANLRIVSVNGVQMATMTYDLAGNRTNLTDANTGAWTYTYDALGNLTQVVDAKAQTTRYTYDLLRRATQRIDLYGAAGQVTNNWTWDTAPYGIGQLASRTNNAGFTETYNYRSADSKLDSVVTDINVSLVYSGSYTRTLGYDSQGRVSSIAYPSGSTFTYAYNTRGYPTQIKNGTTVLQDIQDTDAFGSEAVTSFANGLKTLRGYDPNTGRLSSIQTGTIAAPKNIQDLEYQWRSNSTLYKRIDHRNTTATTDDYTDTFSYDALERVTSQATTVGATRTLSFGYDLYGNLTAKTSSKSGDQNVTPYTYGVSGKPHRLASVTIGAIANALSYDANGSITTYDAASGNDTFLSYDGQNNVTKITVGTSAITTTPTARDEFWYDPDGQRFLGRESWDASGTQKSETTVYLGAFEEVVPASGSAYNLVQRTDLSATVRHIRTRTTGGVYASRFEYVHRDHLGSVDAVTDSSGALLNTKTSHDAFAGRREANWGSDITTASMNTILTNEDERFARGYTDHEQLNRTGFIHMNGRVYDPRIARFVSADPLVQSPFHSQSYNRYAYVFNSPLSRTDPTGFIDVAGGVQMSPLDPPHGPEWIDVIAKRMGFFDGMDLFNANLFLYSERTDMGNGGQLIGIPDSYRSGNFSGEVITTFAKSDACKNNPKCSSVLTGINLWFLDFADAVFQGATTCLRDTNIVFNDLPTRAPNRPGAYGVPEAVGTAAVDRDQWLPEEMKAATGSKKNAYIDRFRSDVSGWLPIGGGRYLLVFSGITDNIGPASGVSILEAAHPGRLLIELPGGPNMGRVDGMLIVGPPSMICPLP